MVCFALRKSWNSRSQSDGIIELNDNYEVGQSYSNYLDDESSEIEIAITLIGLIVQVYME